MRFNRNIYMRLYHIAFFIPHLFNKDPHEHTLPSLSSIPIDDENLRKEFFGTLNSVLSVQDDSHFILYMEYMQPIEIEVQLFQVYWTIYYNLSPYFAPYEKDFKQKIGSKKNIDMADDPGGFYKLIPQGTITKDEIIKESYGVFISVKSACYFYCKFSPIFLLYAFSNSIKTHKNEIPVLVYLRDEIAKHFCYFPVESFSEIRESISSLYKIIELYFKVKEAFNSLQKKELIFWNYWLDRIYDGITIKAFSLTKNLSVRPNNTNSNLVLERLFNKKYNTVEGKEKKRRKKISETQNKRFAKRKEQVRHHLEEIAKIVRDEKITKKEACKQYFAKHESELKSINITSSRTLQNLCSHTKPNKQRSDFFDRSYIKIEYSTDFQKSIKTLYENIIENPPKT